MNRSRIVRKSQSGAAQAIERLENRVLLSATATTPFDAVTLQPGVPMTVDLSPHFNDPTVTGVPTVNGTTVVVQTNNGNIPMELLDNTAPLTVANFLAYVDSGRYADTIFHRVVKGFIDQGGGFNPDGTMEPTFPPVMNEFHVSNTRGTVALAKLGSDPNSGTNQFFINEADNSSNLDMQNGGFTVFAQVINNGMTVADAINNLPTIDASSQITQNPGTFTQLPVQNALQLVSPSNEVVISNITRVLSFSVANSNPSLVTATVTGGNNVMLTPVAGAAAGSAQITVTATDGSGGTASQTMTVSVAGSLNAVTGAGAAQSIKYKDANGTTATIALHGPGTATVHFSGNHLALAGKPGQRNTVNGDTLSIFGIDTSGTTAASSLAITTHGGTHKINIGAINVNGSLRSLDAPGVIQLGNLAATGSIGALTLNNATGQAISAASIRAINVPGAFNDTLSFSTPNATLDHFQAGALSGGTWQVGGVKSIASYSISGWVPTITGTIGSMFIRGPVSNVTLTAGALRNAFFKGALTNCTFTLTAPNTNDLKHLLVDGGIASSQISAAGSIVSVATTSLTDSALDAGVGPLPTMLTLPASATDFAAQSTIKSVQLMNSFDNSEIAAHALGNMSLTMVSTSDNQQVEGLSASTIKSVSTKVSVTLKNKKMKTKLVVLRNLTAANVSAKITRSGATFGDFQIRMF